MYRQLVFVVCLVLCSCGIAKRIEGADPQLAHIVFFTLSDDTVENRAALVADCHKYLDGHEGTVYFSAGAIADDMKRSVNDRGFHVALHLIFANKKAHDTYNVHKRHDEFKEKNKDVIAKVRVFDSYLTAQKTE